MLPSTAWLARQAIARQAIHLARTTSLQSTKNMNFDVLFTYLLHPGTAIYVGYNSNLENVDADLCLRLPGSTQCDPNGPGLLRTRDQLTNDGRQLFVKISYLFRRVASWHW